MEEKEKIKKLRRYFLAQKETIAVAESVTSGWLQVFLSNIPDAGKFYQGGITAYNIGQKYKHLAVEPIHAQDNNCVSGKVAGQMALEVCNLFRSNWGIGITGYATPVPESGNRLFAHYAISYKGEIVAAGEITSKKLPNHKVQQHYADEVTTHLVTLVQKRENEKEK